MGWRQHQDETNRINRRLSKLFGLVAGGIFGAVFSLPVCLHFRTMTFLFSGDMILTPAIVFGICGYIWGEQFVDAVTEILPDWASFWNSP